MLRLILPRMWICVPLYVCWRWWPPRWLLNRRPVNPGCVRLFCAFTGVVGTRQASTAAQYPDLERTPSSIRSSPESVSGSCGSSTHGAVCWGTCSWCGTALCCAFGLEPGQIKVTSNPNPRGPSDQRNFHVPAGNSAQWNLRQHTSLPDYPDSACVRASVREQTKCSFPVAWQTPDPNCNP